MSVLKYRLIKTRKTSIMKKSILTIGKELRKQETKNIIGGYGDSCSSITKYFDCLGTTGCAWSGGCYNA